jgi:hypothetical protein
VRQVARYAGTPLLNETSVSHNVESLMLVSDVSILPCPGYHPEREGQRGFTRQVSTVVKTARRLHVAEVVGRGRSL